MWRSSPPGEATMYWEIVLSSLVANAKRGVFFPIPPGFVPAPNVKTVGLLEEGLPPLSLPPPELHAAREILAKAIVKSLMMNRKEFIGHTPFQANELAKVYTRI